MTLNFNWIKCGLEVDILTQIVLTLLTFLTSPILRNIPICCRRFLFDVSYNVNFQLNLEQSDHWIMICQAKFELECILLTLIYTNSKFKVACKNADFEYWYIRTHTEEIPSKLFNVTFAIFPFSHKSTLLKCHPEYFGVYFSWWTHQMRFKRFILIQERKLKHKAR